MRTRASLPVSGGSSPSIPRAIRPEHQQPGKLIIKSIPISISLPFQNNNPTETELFSTASILFPPSTLLKPCGDIYLNPLPLFSFSPYTAIFSFLPPPHLFLTNLALLDQHRRPRVPRTWLYTPQSTPVSLPIPAPPRRRRGYHQGHQSHTASGPYSIYCNTTTRRGTLPGVPLSYSTLQISTVPTLLLQRSFSATPLQHYQSRPQIDWLACPCVPCVSLPSKAVPPQLQQPPRFPKGLHRPPVQFMF